VRALYFVTELLERLPGIFSRGAEEAGEELPDGYPDQHQPGREALGRNGLLHLGLEPHPAQSTLQRLDLRG